jgi:NADH-quinone oxidoreductase subunit B
MGVTPVTIGSAADAGEPEPTRIQLDWGRRYSLWVLDAGLACCAVEFVAATMDADRFGSLGVTAYPAEPQQADILVVSGTVTDKMAPAIKRMYDELPDPKYVISFGSCANCGGPYWDSYSVTKGIDQFVPVDVFVPGCPPRPEALFHGIATLYDKLAAEAGQLPA